VITDNNKSYIFNWAKKNGIRAIVSDSGVPGRFSVLSKSGLFPAHLAGINCEEVLGGAAATNTWDAYRLACMQFLHYKSGKNIVVLFPYAEALSELGAWYVQLISESIGKTKKIGITPVTAMGAKDQHSLLQLFLDGPDDKFYIFLTVKNFKNAQKIPGEKYSLAKLMNAEFEGVKKAFDEKKKPYAEISIDKISEESLGELFFFFEMEIAFLGQLFNVNIENQPGVELSKKITKTLLK
jgi:glucose-6-phosphate isomerase